MRRSSRHLTINALCRRRYNPGLASSIEVRITCANQQPGNATADYATMRRDFYCYVSELLCGVVVCGECKVERLIVLGSCMLYEELGNKLVCYTSLRDIFCYKLIFVVPDIILVNTYVNKIALV